MDQIESIVQFSHLEEIQYLFKAFIYHTLQCNIIFMPIIKTVMYKFHPYFTPQQFITVTNEPVTQMNKFKW